MIYIVIAFIAFLIVVWIISVIYKAIGGTFGKAKVSLQINSNPEAALQTAIKSHESLVFTDEEYGEYLLKIVEKTGYVKAMVKLAELYEKRAGKLCEPWRKRAAEAGDLDSIKEYYFKLNADNEFDIIEIGARDEILTALNKVKPDTEESDIMKTYLTGLVYFICGDTEKAKSVFTVNSKEYAAHKLMLVKCFEKEKNYIAAEKKLREIVSDSKTFAADAYSTLYDYYLTGRDGIGIDLLKALEYADKYSVSEDADETEAKIMHGKAYYNLGETYRQGLNGSEKDIKKSYEFHGKAVEYGNTDALYQLGRFMLIGEVDGVFINRDYYKANDYLRKAKNNGNQQAKELLDKFGVGGIIIASVNSKAATYKFMGGHELTASSDIIKWLQLHIGIRNKATITADTFMDDYTRRFGSFEQMMDEVHTLYAEYVAQMLQWAINLLLAFDIDSYDAGAIMSRCNDLSLLPQIPKFVSGLEAIDNRAVQLNLETAYVKATRGRWVGGGFGTTIGGTITGAVKGSIAAGVMNAGSGILHGIGDSIVKAMNNSEIKGMGNKLFKNQNTTIDFRNAVVHACNDIGNVLRNIIIENSNVIINGLEGKISYNGESLADLEDNVLIAKINNNLSIGKFEYSYALAVEKLRRDPMSNDVFRQLYDFTIKYAKSPEDYEVLERYRGDFGLKPVEIQAAQAVT